MSDKQPANSDPASEQAAVTTKAQYKKAQHAMRNLRKYNSYLGHDYFLRNIQWIPVTILMKAWAGL